MPGAGLEPASPIRTQEPESCVFANFTIWADYISSARYYKGSYIKSQDIFLKFTGQTQTFLFIEEAFRKNLINHSKRHKTLIFIKI